MWLCIIFPLTKSLAIYRLIVPETSTGAETNGSQTSDATDSAESYDPSDDAPRPGETRREWRMRTGR